MSRLGRPIEDSKGRIATLASRLPGASTSPPPFRNEYQAGGAHVEAFSTALHEAGYDVRAYELNCALDAALSDPDARQRFESRLPPFTQLSGEDVPAEFDDLAESDSE